MTHCDTCNKPTQRNITILGRERIVRIMCDCEEHIYQQQQQQQRASERAEALRRAGLSFGSETLGAIGEAYRQWTFEADDRRDPRISDICRSYAANWKQMRKNNIGLLFCGDVGVGKSFYAACIAHALTAQGISVLSMSFPTLLRRLASFDGDAIQLLRRISSYELVVLDDLGAERETSFGLEQIFSAIDARYLSGKPMIITTNIMPGKGCSISLAYKRIFDRIDEGVMLVKMEGDSRRRDIRREKREEYEKMIMP